MTDINNYEVGHEKVREFYKEAVKQLPTDPKVGLKKTTKKGATYLSFQFRVGDDRKERATGESFTYVGIQKAIEKAHKISQKLANCQSTVDFWDWWKSEIEGKGQIKNDLMTFGEAIALVDAYFWGGYDRNKNKRAKDKNNPMFPSWDRSWTETYGRSLSLVPEDAIVSYELIEKALNTKEKGTKAYKGCVTAFKKMAELSGHDKLWDKLNKIDTRIHCKSKQKAKNDDNPSEYDEIPLQTISSEEWLNLYKAVLEYGENNKRCWHSLPSRKAWLWVFSMQVVYGFRISEVFAIKNLDKPYRTKDGVLIPALNDPKNTDMVAVMDGITAIGTSTKTGGRLATPLIPPNYPNLIDQLSLKNGKMPQYNPREGSSSKTIAGGYCHNAHETLKRWQKQIESSMAGKPPLTQTHALRHLANLNGLMAGISLEQRALSLGHTPAMNDLVYKKRQATKTTLAMLTTKVGTIPVEGAMGAYKAIYGDETIDDNALKLIASIYGLTVEKVKGMIDS